MNENVKNLVKNQTIKITSIGKKADSIVAQIFRDFDISQYIVFDEKDIGQFGVKTYKINGTPEENIELSKNIRWIVRNYYEGFIACCIYGDWMKIVIMEDFK